MGYTTSPAYAEIMAHVRQGFADNLGEERTGQLEQQGLAMSREEGHEWMVKVLGEISD
jgi:hypothetical protein